MGSSNSSDSSSSNSLSNSFGELVGGVVGVDYHLLKNKMGVEIIRSKLRKELDKDSNLERQIKEKYGLSIDEFAVALGDEELFKKTFLLPNYQPHKILEEVEKELEQVKMLMMWVVQ